MSRTFCHILVRLDWDAFDTDELYLTIKCLRILLAGFVVIVWSTASESMVLGLPGIARSMGFFKFVGNFFSHHVTVIKCDFTFFITNIFGCFHDVMTRFEPVKHRFLNQTILHVRLCGCWNILRIKQCTTCQRTNFHDTTNHSRYLSRFKLL